MYKVLHKLSPSFNYAVDITLRTARNIYRLFVPRVRTTLAKHSFYYRAARKLEQFKSLYQSFILLTVYVCVYVLYYNSMLCVCMYVRMHACMSMCMCVCIVV